MTYDKQSVLRAWPVLILAAIFAVIGLCTSKYLLHKVHLSNSYFARGVLASHDGHYALAEELMRRSIKVLPDSYASHMALGGIETKRNKYVEAISELRLALNLANQGSNQTKNEDMADINYYLGNALYAAGHQAEACRAWQAVLDLDSRSPFASSASENLRRHSSGH